MTRIVLVCRVDKLIRRECCATFLTLVAISTLCSASWASADNVTVGEEFPCHLVAVLLLCNLLKLTLFVESAEEVGGELVVYVGCCAAVYVERDTELLERVLYQVVVAVDNLLHGDALFACADGHRHAVFVRAANEDDVLLLQAQVAYVDVRRDIDTGKVLMCTPPLAYGRAAVTVVLLYSFIFALGFSCLLYGWKSLFQNAKLMFFFDIVSRLREKVVLLQKNTLLYKTRYG